MSGQDFSATRVSTPHFAPPHPNLTPHSSPSPFPPPHTPLPFRKTETAIATNLGNRRLSDTSQSRVTSYTSFPPGTTTLGPLHNTGSHLKQFSQHPLRQREHLLTSTPAAAAFAAASNSAFFQSALAPDPLPTPLPMPPAFTGASAAPQIAQSRDTPKAPISAGGRSSIGRAVRPQESPPAAAPATLSPPVRSGRCRRCPHRRVSSSRPSAGSGVNRGPGFIVRPPLLLPELEAFNRAAAAAAAAAEDDTDAPAAGLPVFRGVGGGGSLGGPPPESCGATALPLPILPPAPPPDTGSLLAGPRAVTERGVLHATGGLSVPFDTPTPTITGGLPAAAPPEPEVIVLAAVGAVVVAVAAASEPELRPTDATLDEDGDGVHDETDDAHDTDSADDNNGAGGALTARSAASGALSPACCCCSCCDFPPAH